jgi:REase_DpnII-MboI
VTQKQTLRNQVSKASASNALLGAFSEWLSLGFENTTCVGEDALKAAAAKAGERSSRGVALLGFHSASRRTESSTKDAFFRLLEWVMGKPNYNAAGEPCSALVDPIILLGIQVGVEAAASEEMKGRFREWVNRLMEDVRESVALKSVALWDWQVAVFRMIFTQIFGGSTLPGTDYPLWITAGLSTRGLCHISDQLAADVLKDSLTEADESMDDFEAALRLKALEWARDRTLEMDLRSLTVSDVARILDNVAKVFLRWVWEEKPRTTRRHAEARKWHIENEYHVQSLLYAVLKPVFAELEEEKYLTSTGRYQPRADLCLPSLRLIIEVKYWYQGASVKELTEQVASDHSLYLRADSLYQRMIAIIWDEGARTEQHGEFVRGLSGLTNMYRVIVLARPSLMEKRKDTRTKDR